MPDDGRADEAGPAGDEYSCAVVTHDRALMLLGFFCKGTVNGQQILAVAAFRGALREPVKLVEANVSQTQRDLLGTGDPQPLALLQDLHEMAGFDQAFMRAGIEPGETAAEHLDDTNRRVPDRSG